MFIELAAGRRRRAGGQARLHDPDRARRSRTSTRTRSSSVLDADTRDYLQLLVNGAGQRPEGARRRPARPVPRASSRPTATSRASTARSPTRRKQPAPPRQLAATCSTTSSPSTTTTSRGSSTPPRPCSTRSLRGAGQRLRRRARAAEHAAQTTDTLDARRARSPTLLGPTTEKLRPAARALAPANEAVRPFAKEATPLLRDDIRPFVREARPLVRDLRPAATQRRRRRRRTSRRSFVRFNHFLNLLGYNPNGREDPDNADPPGGLPVLAGVGCSTSATAAVLDLRRQRRRSARSRSRAPCATLDAGRCRTQPQLEFTSDADAAPDRLQGLQRRHNGGNGPQLPDIPKLPSAARS